MKLADGGGERRAAPALAVLVAILGGVGCNQWPGGKSQAGANVDLTIGQVAPYRLSTHCGVVEVRINGKTFDANPPLVDETGSVGPPSAGFGALKSFRLT